MVKGEYADRTLGKTKKLIGKATGNHRLESEGDMEYKRGRGKRLARKIKGKLP